MINNNQFYLYLKWPKYLAQWYAHEMYRLKHFEDEYLEPYQYNCDLPPRDLDPVETQRGSVERNILEMFLSKPVTDYPEKISERTTIKLVIPNFIHKPAETYNYLRPRSQQMLESTVRNHLRVEFNRYVRKIDPLHLAPIEEVLSSFMENNGIENNDTNMTCLKQLWNRLREANRKAKSRKKKNESIRS